VPGDVVRLHAWPVHGLSGAPLGDDPRREAVPDRRMSEMKPREIPARMRDRLALRARLRPLAAALAAFTAALLFARAAEAHEPWVLTPDEIALCLAKPTPVLFTSLSATNVTMVLLFLLFILGWVRLGRSGARELFPDLQARLSSYGDYVAPVLRFCLAWTLLSAAFGVEPRVDVRLFSEPTLFFPELQLRLLDPTWGWLRWAETIIGLALLLGIYVRVFALLLIPLALLGAWLFGLAALLPYIGAVIGTAVYLVMQGPGIYFLPLPTASWLARPRAWLASLPRQRAQAIMRVLTGASILYAAIAYEVLHPTLMIGIIEIYNVPLLSDAPAAFTLLMALIEVTAGLLMIAGILLRPLSLILLFAFVFFAILLPEGYMAHAVFYGVMISFLFNAAGHWRMPEARDRAAEIVVVGSGIAAISAAMRIEKLIGIYTRVRVTLVSESSNLLFYPLLPEVVSGGMQPGSVINPIRRIVPQIRVLSGHLDRVDSTTKQVVVHRKNSSRLTLRYDQLVLAPFLEPDVDLVPGMMSRASTINSVGDALHIRKRILDLIEDAELAEDAAERGRLLTFAVAGSGQRACATAIEICELLRTSEVSYPVLRKHGWQVCLYEDAKAPLSDFEMKIGARRDRALARAGVRLCREDRVAGLQERSILLASGRAGRAGPRRRLQRLGAVAGLSAAALSAARAFAGALQYGPALPLRRRRADRRGDSGLDAVSAQQSANAARPGTESSGPDRLAPGYSLSLRHRSAGARSVRAALSPAVRGRRGGDRRRRYGRHRLCRRCRPARDLQGRKEGGRARRGRLLRREHIARQFETDSDDPLPYGLRVDRPGARRSAHPHHGPQGAGPGHPPAGRGPSSPRLGAGRTAIVMSPRGGWA
jgi:uncharacterized membrane protein YphA (DoxX/SURF4 family)